MCDGGSGKAGSNKSRSHDQEHSHVTFNFRVIRAESGAKHCHLLGVAGQVPGPSEPQFFHLLHEDNHIKLPGWLGR